MQLSGRDDRWFFTSSFSPFFFIFITFFICLLFLSEIQWRKKSGNMIQYFPSISYLFYCFSVHHVLLRLPTDLISLCDFFQESSCALISINGCTFSWNISTRSSFSYSPDLCELFDALLSSIFFFPRLLTLCQTVTCTLRWFEHWFHQKYVKGFSSADIK